MTKMWAAAFAVAAAINLGGIALAQSAMSGDAMHGDAMHGDAMSATPTMVCRNAAKTDTPNAMMGTSGLTCKTFDFAKAKATFMQMMKEASASGTPTQAQINAAYQKAFGDMSLLGHPQ
jgi:pentapeptide MXKDX repeat protein